MNKTKKILLLEKQLHEFNKERGIDKIVFQLELQEIKGKMQDEIQIREKEKEDQGKGSEKEEDDRLWSQIVKKQIKEINKTEKNIIIKGIEKNKDEEKTLHEVMEKLGVNENEVLKKRELEK